MLRATGEGQREGGVWNGEVLSPFAREVKTPEITLSRKQHGFLILEEKTLTS